MTSRRRGEDSIRLYDFAKRYQENQSSSEMVKKQNATEEKVLLAQLEYLSNQKELTKKMMEKEIDLVRKNNLSGPETSRKSGLSYHMDRSPPNTAASTRAAEKCERCLLLVTPQSPSKELKSHCSSEVVSKDHVDFSGRFSTKESKQQGNVAEDLRNNEKQAGSCFQETTCVITENLTRVRISKTSSTKRQARNCSVKRNSSDSKLCCVGLSPCNYRHLTNDDAENIERNGGEMKQVCCRIRSHYSHALEARRQAWMQTTPTPFSKVIREESLTNGTLVQSNRLLDDRRNNQLRFSRTMSDSPLTLRQGRTKSNAIGVAVKDSRFKKLESLLVPIKQ